MMVRSFVRMQATPLMLLGSSVNSAPINGGAAVYINELDYASVTGVIYDDFRSMFAVNATGLMDAKLDAQKMQERIKDIRYAREQRLMKMYTTGMRAGSTSVRQARSLARDGAI